MQLSISHRLDHADWHGHWCGSGEGDFWASVGWAPAVLEACAATCNIQCACMCVRVCAPVRAWGMYVCVCVCVCVCVTFIRVHQHDPKTPRPLKRCLQTYLNSAVAPPGDEATYGSYAVHGGESLFSFGSRARLDLCQITERWTLPVAGTTSGDGGGGGGEPPRRRECQRGHSDMQTEDAARSGTQTARARLAFSARRMCRRPQQGSAGAVMRMRSEGSHGSVCGIQQILGIQQNRCILKIVKAGSSLSNNITRAFSGSSHLGGMKLATSRYEIPIKLATKPLPSCGPHVAVFNRHQAKPEPGEEHASKAKGQRSPSTQLSELRRKCCHSLGSSVVLGMMGVGEEGEGP